MKDNKSPALKEQPLKWSLSTPGSASYPSPSHTDAMKITCGRSNEGSRWCIELFGVRGCCWLGLFAEMSLTLRIATVQCTDGSWTTSRGGFKQ